MTRIGHGIDAHRLVPGRPLLLGGVEVPHDRGLEGHSDGDVVAHALAAALLGGAGLGDLGRHFPSDAPRWRGAAGCDLVAHAAALVAERGLRVESAHCVAIAQEPRLADHLGRMERALTAALGEGCGPVAVTVTSTDGLGVTGRGEGIAASAVVLLAPIP